MTEAHEILQRMKKIEDYFQRCSMDNKLFIPEYECAKKIREIAGHGNQLTEREADDILKIYNETNEQKHYDGSGWMDYQLHLSHLMKVNNLNIKIKS